MKKIIYITSCLLALLTVSCTETTTVEPGEYQGPASIEVSSPKLVFDAEGGIAALVVATNLASWEYSTSDTWFSIEKKENNILEITAPINVEGQTLTGKIIIKGTRDNETVSTEVLLVQGAERGVNLSANGLSNCYIAKTNSAYTFDATIKGNGSNNDKSTYVKIYGLDIKGVAYADLLWEARNDADKSMSLEIIDGAPIYKNGFVSFHTGRSQGNAVIAVKDINGNILWSWHIWVCDDPITSHKHINSARQPAGEIMDRNLGALNNTPMDIDNRGMFYQWGRKDPFMPSRSPYVIVPDDALVNDPANNRPNPNVGNGSGTWRYSVQTLPLVNVPGNIPNAIQNPMNYLTYYFSDYYDWYCASKDPEVINSNLWTEEKTIFDPCPVGYKVPGKDIWAIPSGNTSVSNGGRVYEYDENGENPRYDWNVGKDCGRCWKYTGDYYPMAGNLWYGSIKDAAYNYASTQAFYWTCHRATSATYTASYGMDFNFNWATTMIKSHVFSAQIRCIKE